MSKLQLLHRPWVVFDANNTNHRKYYAEFTKYSTWGRCPVRFIMSDDSNDLVTMIQRKLVEYYVVKEFNLNEYKAKKGWQFSKLTV